MAELGTLDTKTGAGEFGVMSMRVEGVEINVWRSYSYNSHYLTPSDNWSFEVGDEEINSELRKLLIPGNRVEFFIDDTKQASGYIDVVDSGGDRNTGLVLRISGRDTMSPLVDSQIDPNRKFPEKIKLQKLVLDLIADFGFSTIEFENDIDLRLGKKKKPRIRKKKADKFLGNFPIPKKKPQHNDTYLGFLSRITQRYGLWLSPTVDGDGLILAKPNYDQDPQYQARWKRAGTNNNIERGGIRKDGSEQPSMIVARGDIPGRSVKHSRMRVVVDNPYWAGLKLGLTMQEQSDNPNAPVGGELLDVKDPNFVAGIIPRQEQVLGTNQFNDLQGEALTLNSVQARFHTEIVGNAYTQIIPVKPIALPNIYATKVSRPRFIKDADSHTLEELTNFAKRQMSLCTRKAFVAHYEFMGHTIDGVIPQVDTIIDVDDEAADYRGQLWILSRTFNCNRNGGLSVSIEAIPINSIFF